MNSASGTAACPGPPASPTTALLLGCGPASLRLTLSAIEPGTFPVRASGTGTEAHEKAVVSGHGVKVIEAAVAGGAASRIATSASRAVTSAHGSPAGIVVMARLRIADDDSGPQPGPIHLARAPNGRSQIGCSRCGSVPGLDGVQ